MFRQQLESRCTVQVVVEGLIGKLHERSGLGSAL